MKLNILVYKTPIRPVVLYGSETWALTSKDSLQINTWERKVLRWIFGSVNDSGVRRIRTNKELADLYQETNLTTLIRIQYIKWLCHVQMMEEGREPKQALDGRPGGWRGKGPPHSRWLDGVENDLRKMGVRGRRRCAENRNIWEDICKEARVLQRL